MVHSQKPTIRHLGIVVDPTTCDDLDISSYCAWSSVRIREVRRLMREEKGRMTQEKSFAFIANLEKEYRDAVGDLLSLVAADLETLCLLPLQNPRRPKIPKQLLVDRPDFPKLRELWCGGDMPFPLTFVSLSPIPRPFFPALTRLHIFEPTQAKLRIWQVIAPKVESVRVTLCFTTFVYPTLKDDTFLNDLKTSLSESSRAFIHLKLRRCS